MFVGVFAFLILKEKLSKYDVIALIAVFIGVVLISNPLSED